MIESGSILELSNKKKYLITDGSLENGYIYYLTLEVDNDTEIPTENSVFFKQINNNKVIPVTNEDDIDFLKSVFVNRFLNNFIEKDV